MKCPLCGAEFEKKDKNLCANCPLHKDCNLIGCPNCGYQFLDKPKGKFFKKIIKGEKDGRKSNG